MSEPSKQRNEERGGHSPAPTQQDRTNVRQASGNVPVVFFVPNGGKHVNDVLEIYDQACAAWLLCSGVKLVRVIPDTWCRYAFLNDSQQASTALERWKSNTGIVRVRDYAKAYSLIIKLTKTSRLTAKGVENGSAIGAA